MDWTSIGLWLAENYPGLILAIVATVATWFLTRFYYNELKPLKKQVKDLPCSVHEGQFQKIMDKLETISLAVVSIKPSTLNSLTVKQSPRQLNDYGKALFDDCNGAKFLRDNREFLLTEIEKRKPKTALDVEDLAGEILMLNLNSEIFNELKIWVYNSPTRKLKNQEGEEVDHIVSMGDICIVLGLPLRDMYLAAHPEIKTE